MFDRNRNLALAALACASLFPAQPASPAAPLGPFAPFAGSFRGGGYAIGTDGHRERLSCRATGAIGAGGATFSQAIVCASDSYRFDIHTNLGAEDGRAQGQWSESTRGYSGGISGRIDGGRFTGQVEGGGFNVTVSLRATPRGVSMVLTPHGADFVRVEVAMSR